MNNNEELFNEAKNEIEKLWSDNKKLSDFVNWPNDLILKEKNTHKINVADKLSTWKSPNDNQVDKIHNLISNLSPHVHWENGYSENEVNREFLNKYGFFDSSSSLSNFASPETIKYNSSAS